MTITLTYPVEVEYVRYEQLTLRRPSLADQLDLPELDPTPPVLKDPKAPAQPRRLNEEERVGLLLANLCEVPPTVIAELDWVDYDALKTAFNDLASPAEGGPTLRRPRAGDFWAVEEGARDNADREFRLIARCAGLSHAQLRTVPLSHYRACQEQLLGFKTPQPKTSEASS